MPYTGELNKCILPESMSKTLDFLCCHNGPDLYNYHVLPKYGHIDPFIGKNASKDVFPIILKCLEQQN